MIPAEITRELRRSILSPKALCDVLGYESKKASGGGVLIRCPFHAENSPSCSVRLGKDGTIAVKCFSCGKGGDAFTLIANAHGLSNTGKDFFDVLRKAAEIASRWDLLDELDRGHRGTETPKSVRPTPVPEAKEPDRATITDARFHEIASLLFERCPLDGDALACTHRRGIGAHAQAFGCGGLPTNWKPIFSELCSTFGVEDVEASGLVSQKGYFMPTNHRLLIPWCNQEGRIETIECCRIVDGDGPKRLFLSGRGPRSPFGVSMFEEMNAAGPLVICEGAIDTLSRRALALRDRECLQAIGVASVTILFADKLCELSRDRDVVISLDADPAGDRGAEQIRQACAFAKSIRRERPRGRNDVNEVLIARGVAA